MIEINGKAKPTNKQGGWLTWIKVFLLIAVVGLGETLGRKAPDRWVSEADIPTKKGTWGESERVPITVAALAELLKANGIEVQTNR